MKEGTNSPSTSTIFETEFPQSLIKVIMYKYNIGWIHIKHCSCKGMKILRKGSPQTTSCIMKDIQYSVGTHITMSRYVELPYTLFKGKTNNINIIIQIQV